MTHLRGAFDASPKNTFRRSSLRAFNTLMSSVRDHIVKNQNPFLRYFLYRLKKDEIRAAAKSSSENSAPPKKLKLFNLTRLTLFILGATTEQRLLLI
jgi:hypothetical protein